MRRHPRAGFAMGIFLAMAPVLALLAWTFLKVGTLSRIEALHEERRIRSYQAAEAALRCYLLTGKAVKLELNGCHAWAKLSGRGVEASASADENSWGSVTITLELDKGYIMRRQTNEDG